MSYNADKFQLTFDANIVVDGKDVAVKSWLRAARNALSVSRLVSRTWLRRFCQRSRISAALSSSQAITADVLREDQVSYLHLLHVVTAQPGMVQLVMLINRARKLGPRELLQEGIEETRRIIRATPALHV